MAVLSPCFDKIPLSAKDKEFLEKRIKDLQDQKIPDPEIRAAKELQHNNLDDLHNLYHDIGLPGYKNSIQSSKTNNHVKSESSSKGNAQEESSQENVSHETGSKSEAVKEGDVKTAERAGETPAPSTSEGKERVKPYNSPDDIQGYRPDEIMHFNQGRDNNRVTLITDPRVKEDYSFESRKRKEMNGGLGIPFKHILKDIAKAFRAGEGKDVIVDLRKIDLAQPLDKILQDLKPKGEEVKSTPEVKKEPKLSPKQKQINDLNDKIAQHNAMKTTSGETGAPKRALLNEIKIELPEGLHLKVSQNSRSILGIYNEAGQRQQSRSEITNRSEQPFDKGVYRPETVDFVNHLSTDPINSIGLDVQTVDGRDMSPAQLQAGLKDIADGKDTVGAKQIYDAVEKMHEDGMVSVKDNATGNKIGIPIKEFTEEMKKPLEPLTDDQITALNTELGNDAFHTIFSDAFNDFENNDNGQHNTTTSEAEQPANGSATDNKEKTGANSQNSADNQKLRSEQEPPGTGKTTEGPIGDEEPGATGVKKAVINAEREAEGKSPIENQLRRDFGDVLDNAKKLIKNNGSSFVLALKNSIDGYLRPLTAEETVALSLRKAELNNEAKEFSQNVIDAVNSGNKAAELTARTRLTMIDVERDNIDRIATKTNYEKGLSLAINKLLIQDDYSAAKIIHEANALTADGEITPEQKAKFEDLAQKLADAQKLLEEHQQRIAHLEAENKIKEMAKESPPDKFKEKKDKIRAERKNLIDEFKKEIKGGGEGPARQGIALTDKMATIIAKLARNYVEDGIVSLHEIVSHIIDDLKEHAPGLDEENVRNSISGYGRPVKSTKSELTKQMDELRKQAELIAKISDVESGEGIKKKNRSPKKPDSEEVKALQQKLKDAMVAAGIDPYQERALQAFKTRMENQREELKRKLQEKDFAPEEKKTFKRDSEGDKLQADVNGYKKDIRKEMKKIELDQRPKWLKTMDFLAKWRRAVLLSSVTTLGKLSSAALERSIISPIEELAGSIIHFIPGLHQISLAAPREGGLINLTAEKAAAKVWIDKNTLIEAKKELEGKSSLKLLYGKENDLPDTALDWFGRVHAALKTPAKIAEFERSLQKRADYAAANGFDPNDPVIHASLEAQAYIDANRAIFQQSNFLADKWQQAVESLGRGSKSEKAVGDVMKIFLPIVRVPTNFVWESTSYAAGALKVIPTVIKAIHSGVQSLHPDEADFVMRALKKQSLGIAVMALGYFASGSVGGYYTGARKEDDLKAGDIKLFGVHLPHWMLHAPLIEMLQIGATLRRVNDTYNAKGKPGGNAAAGLATVKGLYGQVPFFSTAGGLGNMVENTKSFESGLGEFAKSFIVPPTVQQVAKSGIPFTPIKGDVDAEGNEIERKPQNFLEHIEKGIPGLRETLMTPEQVLEKNFLERENKKFDKQGIPEEDRPDLIQADRDASEERKRKKAEKEAGPIEP